MGTAERRKQIMHILCRRRHETVCRLAQEFGVSERTILRDIDILSLTEPIYTQTGKHGGVYVTENYSIDRMYMSEEELSVLRKLLNFAREKERCCLKDNEKALLTSMISQYTKPIYREEKGNEKTRKRII